MGRFILAILLVLCIQSLMTRTFPKASKEKKKVASVAKPKGSYAKEEDEAVKATDTENPIDEPDENEDEESEELAEEDAKCEKSEEKPVKSRAKQSKLKRKSTSIIAKVNKVTSSNTSKTDESAAEATESSDSVDAPTGNLAVQLLSKVDSKVAEVVSVTGSAAKSKEAGANAAKLVNIKALAKKIDSTGTDEAADQHEKKTAKRRPF